MGDEENPYDGPIPIEKVEEVILKKIDDTKKNAAKAKFVFDGFTHTTVDGFLKFTE